MMNSPSQLKISPVRSCRWEGPCPTPGPSHAPSQGRSASGHSVFERGMVASKQNSARGNQCSGIPTRTKSLWLLHSTFGLASWSPGPTRDPSWTIPPCHPLLGPYTHFFLLIYDKASIQTNKQTERTKTFSPSRAL